MKPVNCSGCTDKAGSGDGNLFGDAASRKKSTKPVPGRNRVKSARFLHQQTRFHPKSQKTTPVASFVFQDNPNLFPLLRRIDPVCPDNYHGSV